MPSATDMKLLALIAFLAIAGASAYLLFEGDDNSPAAPIVVTLPTVTAPVVSSPPQESPRRTKAKGPSFPIATVRPGQRVALHASPAGSIFEQVGDRTEFGSVRVYWIEKVKEGWFGVPTPDLPNGKLAWIKDDPLKLSISQNHFWVSADLSAHRLELHYAKRLLERFPVTVGSRTSPTPLGAYSVTDGLVGRGLGPWYGCCVLALSGKQPDLPAGWLGGDRIAIHGTPGSVGGADSHGCLRASDPDMNSLLTRIPLGTPVFIHV
jgi:L,D-transpeptidase catalytic domain